MEVVLLGTGAADGWPNPFCRCASCAAALATGEVRGHTTAIVDGRLLLDCSPDAPRAAARLGRTLADVRHVLVTHGHWDHASGSALLVRSWAGATQPVDVVGPAAALDLMREWAAPDDPVVWRPVSPGDRLDLDGYRVAVLAAAHGDDVTGRGVLYDVTGPDGGRLLYATDTGPLPGSTYDALEGRAYDLVLLEETLGEHGAPTTDHLDLTAFAAVVGELRSRGAVVDHTDVVAVHLTHLNPPPERLGPLLAAAGGRAVPDGTVLVAGGGRGRAGGRTLVLGGARSGKSAYAERLLAGAPRPTYVATGVDHGDDAEWTERIARHRARRGERWRTVETTDLVHVLRDAGAGEPVLVDCLALWLTAVLDTAGAWAEVDVDDDSDDVAKRVAEECDRLVDAWSATAGDVVVVSNEVGSGVVPATVSGRRFRDELGRLNARMAAAADFVVLLVAGLPVTVKPPGAHARGPNGGAP